MGLELSSGPTHFFLIPLLLFTLISFLLHTTILFALFFSLSSHCLVLLFVLLRVPLHIGLFSFSQALLLALFGSPLCVILLSSLHCQAFFLTSLCFPLHVALFSSSCCSALLFVLFNFPFDIARFFFTLLGSPS